MRSSLRDYRTKQRMSVAKLAKVAAIGSPTIYAYEAGTREPGVVNALKIAHALGVGIEDIWRWE
jgi:DNA-binding XRE family transcriptional regulator